MAKHRIDVDFVDALVGKRILTEEQGRGWLQLALLVVPNPEVEGPWKDFFEADPINGFVPEWYPLHEFLFYDGFHYSNVRMWEESGIWFVKLQTAFVSPLADKLRKYDHIPHLVEATFNPTREEVEQVILTGLSIDGRPKTGDAFQAYIRDHRQYVGGTISRVMYRIQSFVRYCQQQDQYLFQAERKRKPSDFAKNRTGRLAAAAGPRLVYLNELPSVHNNYNEGDGTRHVKAHQRRGHHKTLRHERYKNHRLYQVEKGIYIRPLWVGDRSTIVNGTTYTLVDTFGFKDDGE